MGTRKEGRKRGRRVVREQWDSYNFDFETRVRLICSHGALSVVIVWSAPAAVAPVTSTDAAVTVSRAVVVPVSQGTRSREVWALLDMITPFRFFDASLT